MRRVGVAKKSKLEAKFDILLKSTGIPKAEREYRFHPSRQWRFDYAWPEYMLAVEIEGGVWVKGRHNRGLGFIKDCEKYNAAVMLGWRVLRFPGGKLNEGIDMLEELFRTL